jgi:hypothetical protein
MTDAVLHLSKWLSTRPLEAHHQPTKAQLQPRLTVDPFLFSRST